MGAASMQIANIYAPEGSKPADGVTMFDVNAEDENYTHLRYILINRLQGIGGWVDSFELYAQRKRSILRNDYAFDSLASQLPEALKRNEKNNVHGFIDRSQKISAEQKIAANAAVATYYENLQAIHEIATQVIDSRQKGANIVG